MGSLVKEILIFVVLATYRLLRGCVNLVSLVNYNLASIRNTILHFPPNNPIFFKVNVRKYLISALICIIFDYS